MLYPATNKFHKFIYYQFTCIILKFQYLFYKVGIFSNSQEIQYTSLSSLYDKCDAYCTSIELRDHLAEKAPDIISRSSIEVQ
jgi:hypothetical protein